MAGGRKAGIATGEMVSFPVMAFRGFPADALDFYEGWEADNSRTYWQAHKHVYDTCVRGPMEELLTKLEPEFGSWKIFRPNRDVRFSANKEPYKTAVAGIASADGSAYYVQLSLDGLHAASGYYQLAPDQLSRFRAAIDNGPTGKQLVSLVEKLEKQGYRIGWEGLKSAPRGYSPDHPRIRFLRHKGLTMGRVWEVGAWLGTARAADRVIKTWRAS